MNSFMTKLLIFSLLGLTGYVVSKFLIGKKRDELLSQGEIVARDKLFIRQEHCYFSEKIQSVSDIIDNMDKNGLESYRIYQLEQDDGQSAGFQLVNRFNRDSYIIVAIEGGTKEDEQVYVVSMVYTHNCDPEGFENPYNLLLTRLERAIKDLDADVEVERHVVDYEHSRK